MNAKAPHAFMENVQMVLDTLNARVKLVGLVNIVIKTLMNAILIHVTMEANASIRLVNTNALIVPRVLLNQTVKIKLTNVKSIMLNV